MAVMVMEFATSCNIRQAYGFGHVNKAFEIMATSSDESFDENSKRASSFLRIAGNLNVPQFHQRRL